MTHPELGSLRVSSWDSSPEGPNPGAPLPPLTSLGSSSGRSEAASLTEPGWASSDPWGTGHRHTHTCSASCGLSVCTGKVRSSAQRSEDLNFPSTSAALKAQQDVGDPVPATGQSGTPPGRTLHVALRSGAEDGQPVPDPTWHPAPTRRKGPCAHDRGPPSQLGATLGNSQRGGRGAG